MFSLNFNSNDSVRCSWNWSKMRLVYGTYFLQLHILQNVTLDKSRKVILRTREGALYDLVTMETCPQAVNFEKTTAGEAVRIPPLFTSHIYAR